MTLFPLPEKFDVNEWFLLVISVATYSLLLLPKRFPITISVFLFMFGLSFSRWADFVISSPGALDLYDINDSPKLELADMFTYPLFGGWCYIFIYFYDWLRIRGLWKHLTYILIFSAFGLGIEWVAEVCGMFTYKGWTLAYSFLFFITVQPITIGFYYWLSRCYERYKSSNKCSGTEQS